MPDISVLAQEVVSKACDLNLKIFTAESCTGGMLAACITSVSGSSKIFDYGVVTYADQAKAMLLGVPPEMLKTYGAVSAEVAEAMLSKFVIIPNALGISITGVAGPGGGSITKPVGLVYIGVSSNLNDVRNIVVHKLFFKGSREEIRKQSCWVALDIIASIIDIAKAS